MSSMTHIITLHNFVSIWFRVYVGSAPSIGAIDQNYFNIVQIDHGIFEFWATAENLEEC
jgi:hypothetical protein